MNNSFIFCSPQEKPRFNNTFEPMRHPKFGWYYPPKSLRDIHEIEIRCFSNWPNERIFKMMENPLWRTEFTILRRQFHDYLFCAICEQLLSIDYCIECGQALPSNLPTYSDGV